MRLTERLIKYVMSFTLVWFMYVPEEVCKMIMPSYSINHNIMVVGLVVIICIYSITQKIVINRLLTFIVIYCVHIILNTILHRGETTYAILMYSRMVAMCFLIYSIIRKKDFIQLKGLTFSLNLLVILNLISIYAHVDKLTYSALGHTYLLGFDNGNAIVIFPALIMNYFVNYLERDGELSLRIVLSWIFTVLSVILVDSATTTLGILIFAIMILVYKHGIIKHLNRKTLVIIVLAGFLLVVVFRLQNLFSGIIVNMLGRDITLTGRTALWDKAFNGIIESPILGHGVNPDTQRMFFFGVSSAHSEILDILYQNGFVGFALYFMIFVAYFKTERKKVEKVRKNIIRTIDSMIFAFLVMMIAESYNSYICYGLIFMVMVVSSLVSGNLNWNIKHWKTIKIFGKRHHLFSY